MEWQLPLVIIFGALIILMATGMPVAFCFLLVSLVGVFIYFRGSLGLELLILSFFDSVAQFELLPVPLFILMGEVMFHSRLAPDMMNALDNWLGRLPGRLSIMAVAAGVLFATLTGASMASVAMLGSTLMPEMEKRGYKKQMTIGPIIGSGGLAMMIPPSGLAVLLAALGEISVGKLLMAIIVPGLVMAALYATYIIGRSRLQPHLAPPYAVTLPPLSVKLTATVRYILPIAFIIFLVLGLMFLGVATPTESAAAGALGTFALAAAHGRFNWQMVKKSVGGTLRVTAMMFIIIVGAKAFSQILAASGASQGLAELITGLNLAPVMIVVAMQILVVFLGMFMGVVPIMMITLPIFMPAINALGLDPVWFGVLYLINLEVSTTSPPFGLNLFVMKGVAPSNITMGDIYRAGLPFIGCDLIAMALIIIVPAIALWLPALML